MAYIWIDFYFYQLGSILTFASDYIHFEHMWFSICVYEVGILTLMLESRPVIGWVPLNQILNLAASRNVDTWVPLSSYYQTSWEGFPDIEALCFFLL